MRIITVALMLIAGCGSPCQQIKETRCNAQIVEMCGSNNKWQRVLDCSQVKPIPLTPLDLDQGKVVATGTWTCGKTTTGHTCVPKGK